MATQAEIFNLLEPLLKDSTITSDLQKKIKDVYGSLLDKLKSNIDKVKFESGTVSIGNILNANPEITKTTSKKYEALQKQLIDSITKQVKGLNLNLQGDISLGKIIGESPKAGLLAGIRFDTLRRNILSRIESGLPKTISIDKQGIALKDILGNASMGPAAFIRFDKLRWDLLKRIEAGLPKKISIDKQGIALKDILGDASMGPGAFIRFDKLRWDLLKRIEAGLPKKISIDKTGIAVGDILGNASMGPAAFIRFDKLRWDLLKRIEAGLPKKIAIDKQGVSVGDILGDLPNTNFLTRLRLTKIRNNILSKIEKGLPSKLSIEKTGLTIGDILGDLPGASLLTRLRLNKLRNKIFKSIEQAGDMFGSGSEENGKPRVFEEGPKPVTIASIDPEAIESLSRVLGAKRVVKGQKEIDDTPPKGISKWIAPIMLVLGGLGALAAGLTSSGPAKGIVTMIGKGGLLLGLKAVAKKIGAKALKFLRFIPFVGTLVDLGDAFIRFKKSDFVGGTIALAGGIGSLLNFVVPGLGTGISFGASALNAILDAKAGGAGAEESEKKLDLITSFIKPIKDKVVNWFKNSFIYKMGQGVVNIAKGDFASGFDLLKQGLADTPLGKILSWVSTLASDVGQEYGQAEAEGKSISIFQAFKNVVYEKIQKGLKSLPWWLQKAMSYIPGLKNLIDPADTIDPNGQEGFEDTENTEPQNKSTGRRTRAQGRGDFSGIYEPGQFFGTVGGVPIVNTAKDYVIGAKDGGPIERKLTELVESVNNNMSLLAQQIGTSIQSGMSMIQPTVIPAPGSTGAQVAPLETGKAPSYAMSKIYNQRAKFYALYGGS